MCKSEQQKKQKKIPKTRIKSHKKAYRMESEKGKSLEEIKGFPLFTRGVRKNTKNSITTTEFKTFAIKNKKQGKSKRVK